MFARHTAIVGDDRLEAIATRHFTDEWRLNPVRATHWGNGDARVRLAQLQGALLRECRYLVGLREHTAGMTVDAHEFAQREALRATADPLYGYYALGKLGTAQIAGRLQTRGGQSLQSPGFHDALLAHGDPPMAIVRKIVPGAEDDGTLL